MTAQTSVPTLEVVKISEQNEGEVEVEVEVSNSGLPSRGDMWRARLMTGIAWIESLTTEITGKAHKGQKPYWKISPKIQWVSNIAAMFALMAVLTFAVWNLSSPGWWDVITVPIILIGLVALTGRFRVQVVVFAHHFVHGKGVSRRLAFWGAHIAAALSFGPNPDDYESEHVERHHVLRFFSTLADPDCFFLAEMGFRAGMSRKASYRQLWKTIFSIRFHMVFAKARLKSALFTASWTHRVLVVSWCVVLGLYATVVPYWVFFVVVVLPLVPLYQVSTLLQLLTEHRWGSSTGPADRIEYAERCIGRFGIAEPPARGLGAVSGTIQWVIWTIKMLPNVLVRLGTIVGDLPAHDAHHLVGPLRHAPSSWPKALYERQRAIDEGDRCELANREAMNLIEALDWMFQGLENIN